MPVLAGLFVSAALMAAPNARMIEAARKEGRVVVYSVLSTNAAKPLTEDFKALYPGIEVDYDGDKGSTEMDARYRGETAAGKVTADVVWSSAMDMQMQLVADGYAARYRSPEATALPKWASYQDTAYGSTLEPVVIVYNKNLVTGADIPRSHATLTSLLDNKADAFRGKVTTFDIIKSGVGYMFDAQDRLASPKHGEVLSAMGKAGLQSSGGTGDMLTGINEGKFLLGYNMMGAYALSRSKKDLPNLGVVFPSDYTLVLSRIAFVSKKAAHPNAARLWLDYLLSARGQTVLGNALQLYPIRSGIKAEYTADTLRAAIGPSIRPIALDMRLVRDLDAKRRNEVIANWAARTGVRRN
ncbi:MAG: ABC transporter substrate-binding protein [Pseudomonadota bacterium]